MFRDNPNSTVRMMSDYRDHLTKPVSACICSLLAVMTVQSYMPREPVCIGATGSIRSMCAHALTG